MESNWTIGGEGKVLKGVADAYIQYWMVEFQGWIAQWLEHLVYVQNVLSSISGLVTFLYFNRILVVAYSTYMGLMASVNIAKICKHHQAK